MSPIRPNKKRPEEMEKRTRQEPQYQSHSQLHLNANASSVDLSQAKRSSKNQPHKPDDKVGTSSNNNNLEESSKKQNVNASNSQLYPTIVKQINLITTNTPTAFAKPPLHTPTPQHTDTGKINFEALKANPYLHVQTAKENKRFEFPTYLNNYTCENKKQIDSSFNLIDQSKETTQRFSFNNNIPDNFQAQSPSKKRNCSEDPHLRKHIPELSDSPRIIQAIKANNPKQMLRQSSGSGHLMMKPSDSPIKKQPYTNFDGIDKAKTPKGSCNFDQGRSSTPSTVNTTNQTQPP